jgi:translation initiation factor 3 subunit B
LGVKVDRYSKTSKARDKVTNFELFHIKIRTPGQVAIDVVELTDEVVAFAWEPKGSRFGVIHSDSPGKMNVSFYSIASGKAGAAGTVKKLVTLENKKANHLFWSPKGNHIILAGLKNINGALEFFSVNDLETMGTADHFMCTDIEWDPSGRTVITSISTFRHTDTGYCAWTFQGNPILSLNREKLYSVNWRPRPPSLLSDARIKAISKTLKDRAKEYDREAERIAKQNEDQLRTEKSTKLAQFLELMKQRKDDLKQATTARRALRRNVGYTSDDEDNFRVEETTEEIVLEMKEEEIE